MNWVVPALVLALALSGCISSNDSSNEPLAETSPGESAPAVPDSAPPESAGDPNEPGETGESGTGEAPPQEPPSEGEAAVDVGPSEPAAPALQDVTVRSAVYVRTEMCTAVGCHGEETDREPSAHLTQPLQSLANGRLELTWGGNFPNPINIFVAEVWEMDASGNPIRLLASETDDSPLVMEWAEPDEWASGSTVWIHLRSPNVLSGDDVTLSASEGLEVAIMGSVQAAPMA